MAEVIPQKQHDVAWRDAWAGRRLREIVRDAFPALSSRKALLVITNGLITDATGSIMKNADFIPEPGTALRLDFRHGLHGKGAPREAALADRLRVVYDDPSIVVVSKISFSLVQPADEIAPKEPPRAAPVVDLLAHYWRAKGSHVVTPHVVQRLDYETSGLLVIAKSADAARALQLQLVGERRLTREYMALVGGTFAGPRSGTWRTWQGYGAIGLRQSLAEDGPKVEPPEDAQLAVTHYHVVRERPGTTLLGLRLETGRTHQIRIHCAEAGHPILGDGLYRRLSENSFNRVLHLKFAPRTTAHPAKEAEAMIARGDKAITLPKTEPDRVALHAARLAFDHPETGERMSFEDELPAEFA